MTIARAMIPRSLFYIESCAGHGPILEVGRASPGDKISGLYKGDAASASFVNCVPALTAGYVATCRSRFSCEVFVGESIDCCGWFLFVFGEEGELAFCVLYACSIVLTGEAGTLAMNCVES